MWNFKTLKIQSMYIWKCKISKFQQKCFTTYKWVWCTWCIKNNCRLYYIKFNFKILTFFGRISNYHHFSRWNIEFARILYICTNSYLVKNDWIFFGWLIGEIIIIFHKKLQKNHSKFIRMKKLFWGKKTCKTNIK